jgi:anti-sigma B factor antagonist
MSTSDVTASESLALSVTAHPSETVVALAGALDLAAVDRLDSAVRKLRDDGAQHLVVDLRGLEFLDSSGLRVLIALRNDARRLGQRFTLIPGSRQIERVFDLTVTRGLFDWRADAPTP